MDIDSPSCRTCNYSNSFTVLCVCFSPHTWVSRGVIWNTWASPEWQLLYVDLSGKYRLRRTATVVISTETRVEWKVVVWPFPSYWMISDYSCVHIQWLCVWKQKKSNSGPRDDQTLPPKDHNRLLFWTPPITHFYFSTRSKLSFTGTQSILFVFLQRHTLVPFSYDTKQTNEETQVQNFPKERLICLEVSEEEKKRKLHREHHCVQPMLLQIIKYN